MNLVNGFESSRVLFWTVIGCATLPGVGIGYFVMNVRKLNPPDW